VRKTTFTRRTDEELESIVSTPQISAKDKATAEELLERRRAERRQSWIARYGLLGAILALTSFVAAGLKMLLRRS